MLGSEFFWGYERNLAFVKKTPARKIMLEKDRVNLGEGMGLTQGDQLLPTRVSKGRSWGIYL